MKILFITTYFPPDTSIAAVRPHQFAKRLSGRGHQVTVIRYGLVDKLKGDTADPQPGYRLLTASKQLEQITNDASASHKQPLAFLPQFLRRPLANAYHTAKRPATDWQCYRIYMQRAERLKKVIDAIASEQFDVVFSTYGDLETIFVGAYAAELFHARWIQDYRDTITHYHIPGSLPWNLYGLHVYHRFLKKADAVTAVSHSITAALQTICPNTTMYTLPNGYDPNSAVSANDLRSDSPLFRISYTGQLYPQRIEALRHLLSVLKTLFDRGLMEPDKVRFLYAGSNSEEMRKSFAEIGLLSILDDRGYLNRTQTELLQKESDLFLVLSWNTKKSQGVITGKFYEGIRANRLILAILSGEKPYSELYQIQQKYHYGFCFEVCRRELEAPLMQWLLQAYRTKIAVGHLDYQAPESLVRDFSYEHLTTCLEQIMKNVCSMGQPHEVA